MEIRVMEREDRMERRARRRARLSMPLDTSVVSPCISICQMYDSNGLCIGCARTIDEIREWPILAAEEKRAVLARVKERRAAKAT
jgi:predicted Fe-S protein YdhL (DUF1289 family)